MSALPKLCSQSKFKQKVMHYPYHQKLKYTFITNQYERIPLYGIDNIVYKFTYASENCNLTKQANSADTNQKSNQKPETN